MEPTFEITTEGGHKIVLKSEITFGEKRMISDAFTDAAIYENGEMSKKGMSAQMNASTDKAIETVVVSIDGKTADILTEFMKLPNRDALPIIEKISSITTNEKKD